MKRLLLTGASGFLGWNVCEFPQDDWEIIGIYHENPDGVPDYIESHRVDLRDDQSLDRIFEKTQADAVMHLAAQSNPKECEEHPSSTYQLNVGVSVKIAQICKDFAIPLLFASSEQVYDGTNDNNSETDQLNPINAYGRQKLLAEQKIAKLYPPACMARMAVMYGHNSPTSYCFMHDWLDKWQRGEEVTAFHDEIRSFLSGYAAADALFLLLERQANGLFNLGGKDAISRYEFAQQLATAFDIKDARIKSISQEDKPEFSATRPANLTLNLEKMESMGIETRSVADELKEIRQEMENQE